MNKRHIAIIGGGPAGLAAAEVLSARGHEVTVYEAMPTVARKFLLAGKSGLNITHSEDMATFASRFNEALPRLKEALDAFTPSDVREWADGLGAETFVGTSRRVFPRAMKASPLLRAWLRRLQTQGVIISTRHRWIGFEGDALLIERPEGRLRIRPNAVLLALGGASWPRLGSDAQWVGLLKEQGVYIHDFRPANCGFNTSWSETFRDRFAGEAVKSVVAISPAGAISGEFVVTRHGVEGSLIYAHSAVLRDMCLRDGEAILHLDLAPGRDRQRLLNDLARQPRKASFSNRMRKAAGLEGVKLALLREMTPHAAGATDEALVEAIKSLPLTLQHPRPIAEAISSAGGIALDGVDEGFMLKALPGVFAAGEMLDWEAPTGGYLLTACLATGRAAAAGIETWLASRKP